MKNNVIKNFINIGIGSIVGVLLGFITTPFITRTVDTSVYGKLSVFDSYAGIIQSISLLGLDYSLIRFFHHYGDDEKKQIGLLRTCTLLPFAVAITVFFIFVILIYNYSISFKLQSHLLIFLLINVLVSIYQKNSVNLLRVNYKSETHSFGIIVQKLVYCIIVIFGCLIFKKHYLEILISATILSFLSSSLIACFSTFKYWNFSKGKPIDKKEIIKYGMPMSVYSFLLTLLDSMDKLIIGRYCSDSEVGLYSSAFTLVAIFALLQTTFNAVWIPAQTEQFIKNPDDKTFIKKGNNYITIIMFFSAINMIMFKEILFLILGESYRSASIYMPFLIIESVMYTISDSTSSGIDKSKKSYLNIFVAAIPCVFSFILQIILVPKIGAVGSAISRAIASMIYILLRTHFSNKYYYIDYNIKKMLGITTIVSLYAFVNTFFMNNSVNTVFYLVCIIMLIVLYYKEIIEMLYYFKEIFVRTENE